MEAYCDLEVDVNGEEVFMVDMKVLSSYSGSIKKMFSKSKGGKRNLKVIYHDFPGGAENFELITRFCYNNGKININPFNITDLNCAAYLMEMDKGVTGSKNLIDQTEKSLEDIKYWTWSELMAALKRCQDFFPVASSSGMIEKCLDSLLGRIASSCETSPCPSVSSPDSSKLRASCDTRSSESLKSSFLRVTWWFKDLVQLDIHVIEMLVKSMVSRNLNHSIISKFLFHYQKTRLASTSSDEKIRMVESVVEMLYSLDLSTVSYKRLFGMLRVSSHVNISKCCRCKLESMIGLQLDQATLDDFLVPSPVRAHYLYDVNLVIRLVKSFLAKGVWCLPLSRLKKVASLVDLYIAEVAPDPHLKPSKFLALIRALPDSARDSFDGIYHSVDLYLEKYSSESEGFYYSIWVCRNTHQSQRDFTIPSDSGSLLLINTVALGPEQLDTFTLLWTILCLSIFNVGSIDLKNFNVLKHNFLQLRKLTRLVDIIIAIYKIPLKRASLINVPDYLELSIIKTKRAICNVQKMLLTVFSNVQIYVTNLNILVE
ncbi:BTB/POZ domain-containing protein At3g22104-like [Olea europaea var. sylvestris]|uniref:BTB/POZ domain-containing protein At3g22104-like n=1 Tax=Olea europaea var. sylvestris TaxID=158386 RepID=UPI000C1D6204|nr:BTB/POZ domain-containing protein At3g22104-like [Olea europaea var. sylvestris]